MESLTIKNQILIYLFFLCCGQFYAQAKWGVKVPTEIKKACDSLIVNELGKKAFDKQVHYFKCDENTGHYNDGKKWTSYELHYTFNFPEIKEAHINFSIIYKKDATGGKFINDPSFKNYTRLPESLKKKEIQLLTWSQALDISIKSDSLFLKNKQKLRGELFTEFSKNANEYVFYWNFFYYEPCRDCEMETVIPYSVALDALSGKVIRMLKGPN